MEWQENRRKWELIRDRWIRSFAPPGLDTDGEIRGLIGGLVLALCLSFSFIGKYNDAYSELYRWYNGKYKLSGEMMIDFAELIEGCLGGFYLLCFVCLATVVWHYLYYYQGSKSIYLMKRLPNRMEIHKRAWTLPLLGIGITLLAAFLVMLLYFWIYLLVTPQECIAPGQWQRIWR